MSERAKKDGSIETLRGLAIILMVAGHVIGDDASSGMRISDDSPLRHFYYSFQFLRLPLFTAISGFVYALRPVTVWGKVLPAVRGKVRRLLVPMATVGTVEYFATFIVPGTNHHVVLSHIAYIYCFGFDHFWFLQAIFTAIVVVVVLDAGMLLESQHRWLLTLLVCCLVSLYAPRTPFFSFNGTLYLLPYLVLGVGFARFPLLLSTRVVGPTLLVLVAGVLYQQFTWYSASGVRIERLSPAAMIIGASGMVLAFRFRRDLKPLGWLGCFAYPVYLFHIFGVAPGRMLMVKVLHIDSLWSTFAASLACGLFMPILLTVALRQNRILAALFLGERAPRIEAKAATFPAPVVPPAA